MVIFGTAGHIDHGKTSLIYSLTSIDADRLPEEKSRGMTIDLGFAWMETSKGEKIGIIDVPGHEHFIRNMITGITSVDAFILVVDAKEGWKLQTEEHFQIIRLLEIEYGLIAITKADLVSSDRLENTKKEIQERINYPNKPNIPIIYFSSKDERSISQLKSEIEKISKNIPQKKDISKPRLFIDRVFEVKGSGTVVTGTMLNGNLSMNQTVYHFPSKEKSRLRQIQSYNISVDRVIMGNRVALNLTGLKKEDVKRGDLIYHNLKMTSGKIFDVLLNILPQKSSLNFKNGSEIEFISHTKILRGTIFFKNKEVKPEEKFYAQIRFKESLLLMVGDYFIIRMPGINETIGGGRILNTQTSRYNFHNLDWEKWLSKRVNLDLRQLIVSELEKYQKIKKEELLLDSPYAKEEIYNCLEELHKKNILFLRGDWVVDIKFWNNVDRQLIYSLERKHEKEPLKEGFPIIHLRNEFPKMPEDLFLGLLDYLSENNRVKVKKGVVSSAKHTINISTHQNKKIEEIVKYIEKNITNLPTEKELKNIFFKNTEIIEYLIKKGEILRLEEQILITPPIFQGMMDKVIDYLKKNNTINIAQARDLLNLSRKYLVPILTRMDEAGITVRRGNERILK